jgi:N-acetylglutamate synthase-like GNAT family acetyltransferase
MGSELKTAVIRFAHPDDMSAVRILLTRNGLPTADLDDNQVRLLVACDEQEVIGVVGLELYGSSALLRSLAVADHRRGQAIGRTLYEQAAASALHAKARTLYLLTSTARGYFAALGFAEVERHQLPDSIRGTTQFTSLCPSSATCMTKLLGREP